MDRVKYLFKHEETGEIMVIRAYSLPQARAIIFQTAGYSAERKFKFEKVID